MEEQEQAPTALLWASATDTAAKGGNILALALRRLEGKAVVCVVRVRTRQSALNLEWSLWRRWLKLTVGRGANNRIKKDEWIGGAIISGGRDYTTQITK